MFPSSNREATELEAVAAAGTHTWAWNTTSAVNRPSCPWTRSHSTLDYSSVLYSSSWRTSHLLIAKDPANTHFNAVSFPCRDQDCYLLLHGVFKIPEKVSFYNIASEASYVYILSIKVIKIPKMVNLTSFWKTEAHSQLVLPDRSTSKEQKLVENLMTFFEPFFPLCITIQFLLSPSPSFLLIFCHKIPPKPDKMKFETS